MKEITEASCTLRQFLEGLPENAVITSSQISNHSTAKEFLQDITLSKVLEQEVVTGNISAFGKQSVYNNNSQSITRRKLLLEVWYVSEDFKDIISCVVTEEEN